MKYGKKGLVASFLPLIVFLFSLPGYVQAPEVTGEAALPPPAEEVTPPPIPPLVPPTTEPAKPGGQEEEKVFLNVVDQDIKEVIKQISKATRRNFILDDKVRGKITIISNEMITRSQAYQAFLSALQVAGFTVVEGPAGILKVVPLRDAVKYPIPTHVDTTPYTDRYITRLIRLENISARDMAEAIKGLISKDGNLFAYPETNTMVLTDSGTNIDRLMKIIKELDQEGPQQVVEIVKVHNANSKEIAGIVLNLFEEAKAGAAPTRRTEGLPEVAEVSKIIADERTNSIILLASKRAMDKVKELINRLDARLEEGMEGKIHVHYLKHAKAKDITEVLQSLAGMAAKPGAPQASGASSGVIAAELEEFKVAADEKTNSLLITATPKTYNTLVDRVLSKLDIPRRQVYLESVVMEFFLSRSSTFGVSGHGGKKAGVTVPFVQTPFGVGKLPGGLSTLFDPFKTGGFAQPGLLGGVLGRDLVEIEVPTGAGTETQKIKIPGFSAFITALQSMGDTNIVSTPNVLTLDNEEATIEITQKEPRPGPQTVTAAQQILAQPVEYEEAGLKLKIKPQITAEGNVTLNLENELSTFREAQNPELKAPAKVIRKIKTAVVTGDSQTIVLGGLLQDELTASRQKVPLLGDIPLLGYLFRSTRSSKSKSNLLIFITPHVINNTGDFLAVLSQKIDQRNQFIEENLPPHRRSQIKTVIKSRGDQYLEFKKPELKEEKPKKEAKLQTPVITAKPEEEEAPAKAGPGKPKEEEVKKAAPRKHPPVIEVPSGKGAKELDLTY